MVRARSILVGSVVRQSMGDLIEGYTCTVFDKNRFVPNLLTHNKVNHFGWLPRNLNEFLSVLLTVRV